MKIRRGGSSLVSGLKIALLQRHKTLRESMTRGEQFLQLGLNPEVYKRFVERCRVVKSHWQAFQELMSPFDLLVQLVENIDLRNPWRGPTGGERILINTPRKHYHMGLESSLDDLQKTADFIAGQFQDEVRPDDWIGDLFYHGTMATNGDKLLEHVNISTSGKHDFGEAFTLGKMMELCQR